MQKQINSQFLRIAFVAAILALLTGWNLTWIIEKASVNIILNGTIIAAFLFGVYIMVRNMTSLNNEVHALNALKEEFDDCITEKSQDMHDPLWRFHRCQHPAQVYRPPILLQHAHHILLDEICRQRGLSLTTETVSTMVSGVEGRIDDRKVLVTFIAAMLILLGLIGTFIGLMQTLDSIGDILKKLGDSKEGLTAIIGQLKKPMSAMATGFSSSLFGLVTSLALSVMSRFSVRAMEVVRDGFETWITAAVQIDNAQVDADVAKWLGRTGRADYEERRMIMLLKSARFVISSNSKLAGRLENVGDKLDKLTHLAGKHEEGLNALTMHLSRIFELQSILARTIERTSNVAQFRSGIMENIARLEQRSQGWQDHMSQTMQSANQDVLRLLDALHGEIRHDLPDTRQAEALLKELEDDIRLAGDADKRQEPAQARGMPSAQENGNGPEPSAPLPDTDTALSAVSTGDIQTGSHRGPVATMGPEESPKPSTPLATAAEKIAYEAADAKLQREKNTHSGLERLQSLMQPSKPPRPAMIKATGAEKTSSANPPVHALREQLSQAMADSVSAANSAMPKTPGGEDTPPSFKEMALEEMERSTPATGAEPSSQIARKRFFRRNQG